MKALFELVVIRLNGAIRISKSDTRGVIEIKTSWPDGDTVRGISRLISRDYVESSRIYVIELACSLLVAAIENSLTLAASRDAPV